MGLIFIVCPSFRVRSKQVFDQEPGCESTDGEYSANRFKKIVQFDLRAYAKITYHHCFRSATNSITHNAAPQWDQDGLPFEPDKNQKTPLPEGKSQKRELPISPR